VKSVWDRIRCLLCAVAFILLLCHFAGSQITGVTAGRANLEQTDSEQRPVATFRAHSDLVLIPVTVTDTLNRFVLGFQKQDFQLFEDGMEQNVDVFSGEDAPLSVGVLFDESGSMGYKLRNSRDAAAQLLNALEKEDEAFLVEFADLAKVSIRFTAHTEDIQSALKNAQASGLTAMLDAIDAGIMEMKKAKNSRKALVIVSDGGDNRSRYTDSEIKSLVKEADVQVYAIGLFDNSAATPEERYGPYLLNEVSDVTGGRMFRVDDVNELADVATKIGVELRNQYVLGYRPTNAARDGKWRKIKVKLSAPKGLPPLTVHAKTGYYAPTE